MYFSFAQLLRFPKWAFGVFALAMHFGCYGDSVWMGPWVRGRGEGDALYTFA